MRFVIAAGIAALVFAGCAHDPRYDPGTFERESSANPIDRGTEMLRQIRHAEMERDEKLAGKKKTPLLFKSQEDNEDDET